MRNIATARTVRPITHFDVNNSRHRRLFTEFMRTNSWRHSPVRFTVSEEGEQIAVIMRQLVEYYQRKEFPLPAIEHAA